MKYNNPECEKCGLLRSTILGTERNCINGGEHDFGDHGVSFPKPNPTTLESELQKLSFWDNLRTVEQGELRFFLKALDTHRLEQIEGKISMLRQWLNEERITDPKKMVTNEEIKTWL